MKIESQQSDREVLAGLVECVTYQNADNGFCVIRVKARGHRDLVTVVGHAAVISAGEWITAAGDWTNDRTERRISRWEHEAVLEKVQDRLNHNPNAMGVRRQTAEHPFGTIKCWMGATHFLTQKLPKVATEMALNVLAYTSSA